MGFRDIKIPYDEHKLDALTKALEIKDDEYLSSLVKTLDSLYEQNVPETEKEIVTKKMRADYQRKQIDKNSISLIHIHDDEDDIYLTARGNNTLYDVAMCYYGSLADMNDKEYSVDTMSDVFNDREYLDEIAFNALADIMPDDDRVTLEAHYDFEVGTLEFRDKEHPDMYGYDFNDLSEILDRMEDTYMTEYDREVLFNEHIEDLRQRYDAEQTMGM